MFQTIIKPLPLLFALATTFGVLIHDTKVDQATTVALAVPAALVGYGLSDLSAKTDHTHVERFSTQRHLKSLQNSLPRLQPREEDHRYFTDKKMAGGSDNPFIWPSV